jgi:hypothetical protein
VEPVAAESFAFDRDWLRRQAQRLAAPGVEGMGTALKLTVPPGYLLIHRVWAGGVGVLCQLGATARFRQIVADSLPGFDDPA